MLAHELSHVAHRDVLVMTVASSAGIAAGILTQGAQYGGLGLFGGGRRDNNGPPVWLLVLVVSMVVYAVSFVLLRLLSRYRELSADRAGAYLTLKPAALASALQKITGGVERSRRATCARSAPGARCASAPHQPEGPGLDPPVAAAAPRAARRRSRPSSTGPADGLPRLDPGAHQAQAGQPRRAVPGALGGDHPAGRDRAGAHRRRVGLLPGRCRGRRSPTTQSRRRRACSSAATDAPQVQVTTDGFGFTWLEVDHPPYDPQEGDLGGLCTDLHAVNTTLEGAGFGPALLCSLVPFADSSGRGVGLVYLYKQGTFYPFAPAAGGGQRRDELLEIQVRDLLRTELPVEDDPARRLAIWGAPGLA